MTRDNIGGDGVLPDQETWNQHQEGDWQNLLEATQTQIWGLFDVDKKGQQKIVNIFEDNSSSQTDIYQARIEYQWSSLVF